MGLSKITKQPHVKYFITTKTIMQLSKYAHKELSMITKQPHVKYFNTTKTIMQLSNYAHKALSNHAHKAVSNLNHGLEKSYTWLDQINVVMN